MGRHRADPACVRTFKTLAENIVESLAKRDRVFVHGTVTTGVWTDLVRSGLGPDLVSAEARQL